MAQRISTTDTYAKRFVRFGGPSTAALAAYDQAGNLTANFREAKSVTETQRENLRALMNTAEEMIAGLTTFQQNAGEEMIKNIPLPNQEIKDSAGQSFGYVRLSMRYLQSGFIHFMEQFLAASQRIEVLERHLSEIASYNDEVELHGELVNLDLSDLESKVQRPSPSTPPPTPPAQPPKAALTSSSPPKSAGSETATKAVKGEDKRAQTPSQKEKKSDGKKQK
nr:hypothetical protein [Plasmopara viticola lesion associated mononegaambi virus 7]